ncbi:hypothetical protein [Altericroceibacterium xinjiangense]|uniref:hypothetical protein n=1 Tax=Altericroceibacterium xinjiangense TaxID=762261 RepID=UPI000F7F9484|nr:hypothetical protein [Altericroceibacterium xinjiangense]
MMHEIKETIGAVIAGDTQASVKALDTAVTLQSRMCSNIMEAAMEARLPMGATQGLLEKLASGMNGLVATRSDMIAALRELSRIQSQSNLKTVSYGCPAGVENMTKKQTRVHAG